MWTAANKAGLALTLVILSFSGPVASAQTLTEALVSAYNNHPRLLAERARLREIDESYIQARAQGRFTSNAAGSLGYTAARIPSLPPATGHQVLDSQPLSAQIQVIQPIYQGGRVRALKEQARAGILAAREGLRQTEQSILLSAASAYSDVLRDEEAAIIRRNNVRVLARQLQVATDRFDVGEGSRTDIAQAKARLAAADIGLAQADAQLQISRAAFKRAVGYIPQQLSPMPRFVVPDTVEAAQALGRENSPQIIAAFLNEQAAESAIDVARSASKPTVSISGNVAATRGQLSIYPQSESAAIMAQVSIPIFSGGLNRSRVRAAKEARTRMTFETRDAELILDQTIAGIWAQLDAAKRSLIASQTQVEAAQFAFDGVELEQQLGTRSTLDVLNAEQELLDAKLAVLNTKAAVRAAEFQLLATIGAFDADAIQLPLDSYYRPESNLEMVKQDGLSRLIDKYVPERLKDSEQNEAKLPIINDSLKATE